MILFDTGLEFQKPVEQQKTKQTNSSERAGTIQQLKLLLMLMTLLLL